MFDLSPRELQCLKLMARGLYIKEIAEHLGVSFFTVRGIKRRMFLKLRALNSSHAIAIGFAKGLLVEKDVTGTWQI